MRLLIKRDPTYLTETEGRAEVDGDVPTYLKKSRVVHSDWVAFAFQRHPDDDLILAEEKDDEILALLLEGYESHQKLSGAWSGYRSALVGDGNGGLYRLKGVSFNPENPEVRDYDDGTWEVFGAQPLFCARFEKNMSDKFNETLANEGITPIMTCKGYWHYPTKVRNRKLSASVVKVEGDTRLDEFMFLIENYFCSRLDWGCKVNYAGLDFLKDLKRLYQDIGLKVGQLKRLMDKNYQTWSADNERSNAHVGNIVLYNGTDKVKIGFVDFDASCDTEDFSKSKIKEMQKREYESIIKSAQAGPISMRTIQIGFLKGRKESLTISELRNAFIAGFEEAYNAGQSIGIFPPREIDNSIDFSRFLEIFRALRSALSLKPVPHRISSKEELVGGIKNYWMKYQEPKYTLEEVINKEPKHHINDIYSILDKNRDYQIHINK